MRQDPETRRREQVTRGPRARRGEGGSGRARSSAQDPTRAVGAATARCTDLLRGPRCELEVAGSPPPGARKWGPVLRNLLTLAALTYAGTITRPLPGTPAPRGR